MQNYEIWVSGITVDTGAFTWVYKDKVYNNISVPQMFIFEQPVNAKYVKFVPLDNYGDTVRIALNEFEVLEVLPEGR